MKPYMVAKAGTVRMKAKMSEGITNIKLWRITTFTMPILESPTILMIPNSNVLASMDIMSSE